MRSALHALARAVIAATRLLTRERAVLAGVAVAVLQAAAAGELTSETAVPVIAGIALRFFVSPYDRPASRRPSRGDHADHAHPEAFHGGRAVL